MSEAGDRTMPAPARARRLVPGYYKALSPKAYTALRFIADAEDAGESFPSLAEIATAAGLANTAAARWAVMALSDRRLIDGYGTARRLTEAGWETLEP